MNKLAKHGQGHVKDAYKALQSDEQRKSFALRLKLDPAGSFCQVKETSNASSTNIVGKKKGWFALWEVAWNIIFF